MNRRILPTVLVVVAVAAGTLVSGAAAAPPVVPVTTYLDDVQAGSNALQRFGAILERTESVAALRTRAGVVRTHLRRFDRHMYVLSRYRLAEPVLDRQRARLARTAPPVTATLSRFLDAALSDDVAQVQRLAPVVIRRINAFQRAAAG
ncbi:MAG: hypothetical protein AB7I08_08695 [Thermoleophilia bacterium]